MCCKYGKLSPHGRATASGYLVFAVLRIRMKLYASQRSQLSSRSISPSGLFKSMSLTRKAVPWVVVPNAELLRQALACGVLRSSTSRLGRRAEEPQPSCLTLGTSTFATELSWL